MSADTPGNSTCVLVESNSTVFTGVLGEFDVMKLNGTIHSDLSSV